MRERRWNNALAFVGSLLAVLACYEAFGQTAGNGDFNEIRLGSAQCIAWDGTGIFLNQDCDDPPVKDANEPYIEDCQSTDGRVVISDTDGSKCFSTLAYNDATAILTTGGLTCASDSLTLFQSTSPSQTADGACQWDSDDDKICCGTGSATVCFTSGVGAGGNSFSTIDLSGSVEDPVADSASDTLTVAATSPVVITGSAASDSLTWSLTQNAGTDVTADLEEEAQIKGTTVSDNAADTEILVGDGASSAKWVPMSSDATLANTGALTISSNAVALGADTTGSYAAADAEAGNALSGDSATAFFSSGQIERAFGGTGADTSAYGTGLFGSDGSNATIDVDTSAEVASSIGDETGSGALAFATSPTFTDHITVSSAGGNEAENGVIRLVNAEKICWESAPASTTEQCVYDDANEDVQFENVGNVTNSGGSFKASYFTSNSSDPADAGVLRLGNAEVIGWEKATPGTDSTLKVDSSDIMQSSVTFNAPTLTEGGTGVPNTGDNLSVFAATTSAQLAGVLSDETGTGKAVFANPENGDVTGATCDSSNIGKMYRDTTGTAQDTFYVCMWTANADASAAFVKVAYFEF